MWDDEVTVVGDTKFETQHNLNFSSLALFSNVITIGGGGGRIQARSDRNKELGKLKLGTKELGTKN